MNGNVRTKRDFAALESRRMEAAELFARGLSPAEVARKCGVSNQSAARWRKTYLKGGRGALKHPGRAGRKPMLTSAQKHALARELLRGPESLDHATRRWTLSLVTELIERRFGLRYHRAHVCRLLHSLGWSCRKTVVSKRDGAGKGKFRRIWHPAAEGE